MKKAASTFAEAPQLPLDAHAPITLDRDEVESVSVLPPTKGGKVPSYLADHRKRLRHRFLTGGAAAMPDYEILELTLFRAIPRQDVKPLARRLIDTFGDLNGVLAAPIARLEKVDGVGPAVALELKVMQTVTHRATRARVMQRHVISSWDAIVDYCHTVMSHRDTEQFRVLFLDRKNVLIADEVQGSGTVDHVPVYPREVVKRALELNASAMILVHNHPSGDPTPSQEDIAMTMQISEAAKALGITLHDHLVIGKSRELSFKSQGII